MKTETLLFLGVGLLVWLHFKPAAPNKPPGGTGSGGTSGTGGGTGGGITWISCDDPNADPNMCGVMAGGSPVTIIPPVGY